MWRFSNFSQSSLIKLFAEPSLYSADMTTPSLMFSTVSKWIFRPATNPSVYQLLLNHSSTDSGTVANQGNEPDVLYRKLNVEVRGIDPAVLKSYSWFATTAAKELGIGIGECWAPRKAHHYRLTLLKSVHIYKKHRVQYEVRTYFRHMEFHNLTGSTADTFLEYIQRNLPEGVAMKATKHRIESLPEHLKNSESGSIKSEAIASS